jgi:hypothetical protein
LEFAGSQKDSKAEGNLENDRFGESRKRRQNIDEVKTLAGNMVRWR